MSESDRVCLRHMLDAAREALAFLQGRARDDLRTDRMLALALIKEIEMIGEAAANVSPELKQPAASIPWAAIVGMRNRLIRAYFEVDFNILWDTVTSALDPLILQLQSLAETND